jgi:hypothetical protein
MAMVKPGSVIGWRLDRGEREALLERFPPRYARAIADHVTLKADAAREPLPGGVRAAIVGRADDGRGVEAYAVAIDGTTDRPDGSIFHVTWSLDDGRRARESNDVLRQHGWDELDDPVPLTLEPARF